MIQFSNICRGWRRIASDKSVVLSAGLLCFMLLEGCANLSKRSSSVERELPEMSSVVYFDISNNRRAVFYYSESVCMMPRLIVNYRGNPFVEFTKNYKSYAGKIAISGIGFRSTTLNSSDKKILYEKMAEYDMSRYDTVMSYMWNRDENLPVLIVYEILGE